MGGLASPLYTENPPETGCIVILGGIVIIRGAGEGVVERTTARHRESWSALQQVDCIRV